MRQAVVLIHGIGEQKPMDTLRAFVQAVLQADDSGEEPFYNKPDRMSELFELRKLQSRGRSGTDFYEYYWAYNVEGTRFTHLRHWLVDLLLRRPSKVPHHLRFVWVVSWGLTLVATALLSLAAVQPLIAGSVGLDSKLVWGAVAISTAALQYFLLSYLGDAARYLSPHPKNIALRQSIRTRGIELLRKLHKSKDYERIIVVGHSLGSVIGYDILKHLWQDYNASYRNPVRVKQAALAEAERAALTMLNGAPVEPEFFQKLQYELWCEQRRLGHPWLISDFITLGSPLAHAALLLARDGDDLGARQRQRELPTCPPILEGKHFSYWMHPPFEVRGQKISLAAPHHAALFACTRWTNLYFPAKLGLFGDLVGGPLRPVFGLGVKDCPVTSARWRGLFQYTPLSHTRYWALSKRAQATGGGESLDCLRQAINLRWRRPPKLAASAASKEAQQASDP